MHDQPPSTTSLAAIDTVGARPGIAGRFETGLTYKIPAGAHAERARTGAHAERTRTGAHAEEGPGLTRKDQDRGSRGRTIVKVESRWSTTGR